MKASNAPHAGAAPPGGFKNKVLSVLMNRPCLSFSATLFFALVIGALGLGLGGMSVDTEGWETRGTSLADRAIQYEVWRQGNFVLPIGTPLAMGRKEDNRRRARSLLMLEDPVGAAAFDVGLFDRHQSDTHDSEDDDAGIHGHGHSHGHSGGGRRLQQAYNPAPPAGGALKACAAPFFPTDGASMDYAGVDLVLVYYNAGDLWTPEGMASVCEAEDAIMSMSGYTTWCKPHAQACAGPAPDAAINPALASTYTPTNDGGDTYSRCIPPVSYTRALMEGAGLKACGEFRTNAAVPALLDLYRAEAVKCAVKYKARDPTDQCDQTQFDPRALNAGFGPDDTAVTATRSTFKMYANGKQDPYMEWLLKKHTKGKLDVGKKGVFKVAYSTSNGGLKDRAVDAALNRDMVLSGVAVLVVLCLMWAHTGSLLLTAGGLLQILLAFPSAVFFTTTILQIKFFPFLNFIGIFVIAGVGADDCFVLYDKWIQAKSRLPPGASAADVGAKCYWDATFAMFLTSVTTAAAFVSSAVIPIAPIRVFSIFMAIMIMFDYLYDITVFAACIAFQHRLLLAAEAAPGGGRSCSLLLLDFWGWMERRPGNKGSSTDPEQQQSAKAAAAAAAESTGPLSERVFRNKVYPVLHKARWPLIVLLLALGVAAGWGASGLTTPEDNDVLLLGEDNPLEKFDSLARTHFLSSTEGQLWVAAVFGLAPKDDGDRTDPSKRPNINLDPSFDPTSPEAQTWFRDFCRDTGRLKSLDIDCPMLNWAEWVEENTAKGKKATSDAAIKDAAFAAMVFTADSPCMCNSKRECQGNCQCSCDNNGCQGPGCDAVNNNNNNNNNNNGDETTPEAFATACGTGGFPVPAAVMPPCMYQWSRRKEGRLRSFYYPAGAPPTPENAKIFFLRAQFASNISWTSPLKVMQSDHAGWEDYINGKIATAPAGLRGGYQTSEAWWWMDTVANMQTGAYSAAGITLLLAAVVILAGTGNVVITIYSVGAIFVILAATVATVVAMGWTLGFLEGICFSILIGLSVDFVIHMGHGYVEAVRLGQEQGVVLSRHKCAQQSVATMGFPVLSAGLTTLLSAVILFFCEITFFQKFGTIVLLSMIFAMIATFMLYVPLLDAAGPEGNFGNVYGALCMRKVERGHGGASAAEVVEMEEPTK